MVWELIWEGGINMPKSGFKSITLSEDIYDKFFDVYKKNKEEYAMKGINSFSGYVTYHLSQLMEKDKKILVVKREKQ